MTALDEWSASIWKRRQDQLAATVAWILAETPEFRGKRVPQHSTFSIHRQFRGQPIMIVRVDSGADDPMFLITLFAFHSSDGWMDHLFYVGMGWSGLSGGERVFDAATLQRMHAKQPGKLTGIPHIVSGESLEDATRVAVSLGLLPVG